MFQPFEGGWFVGCFTKGSLESRIRRWPLILEDLKIDTRLLMGNGHGLSDEYKERLEIIRLKRNHFLMYVEIFCSSFDAMVKETS